jgi:hypothetical protein
MKSLLHSIDPDELLGRADACRRCCEKPAHLGIAMLAPGGVATFREEARANMKRRCGYDVVPKGSPFGAERTGVTLCNTAGLKDDQFKVAHEYFNSLVDADYLRMYGRMAGDLIGYVFVALLIWFSLLVLWWLYKWIAAAPASVRR